MAGAMNEARFSHDSIGGYSGNLHIRRDGLVGELRIEHLPPEEYRCPFCRFMVDTPNHEIGCAATPPRMEAHWPEDVRDQVNFTAGTTIREAMPTLAAVALDMSEHNGFGTVRPEEVAYAARRRGIQPKDGRVTRENLADIYFELRHLRGLDNG
jgi:hypothetical protein